MDNRQNFIGGAVIGAVAKAAIPAVIREVIERTTDKATAERVIGEMATDPKAINELSAEKPYQSRVAVGSTMSLAAALAILTPIVAGWLGYDIDGGRVLEVLTAAGVVFGAGYALYGRFKTGLVPLFSRFSRG